MLYLFRAGTAIVQTRLIFNFSTPIPSETLVLSAITALLSSRLTLISDLIQVLNFTYESMFLFIHLLKIHLLYNYSLECFSHMKCTSLSHIRKYIFFIFQTFQTVPMPSSSHSALVTSASLRNLTLATTLSPKSRVPLIML